MPRDHTRVNIDIWGDDDFRDLPVDAQALYWTLWTSPARTYCGSHEWHPGRLAQTAEDWTARRIEHAGAVLSQRLFLIIDAATEECLIRSWIKHDGLWRIPNMSVTMANARSALGSKALRGVIVFEVKKLVAADPKLSSWERPEVKKLLSQNAIDPASLPPFDPGPNPPGNPSDNPSGKGYGRDGVNPPDNPARTTATASSTTSYNYEGGYVSQVCHREPPRKCPRHISQGWVKGNCGECAELGKAHAAWTAATQQDELAHRRQLRAEIDACLLCDQNGMIETPAGLAHCDHPEVRHA